MARFSAGVLTGAGTSVRPMISIFAAAASTGALREVGVFNTTATAVAIMLTRITANGTAGTELTQTAHNPLKPPALCQVFTTHTADATLGEDLGYRAVLGASVGSGVVWTFGDDGILIALPDAALTVEIGIGVILENGTGQACQAYFVWDE